MSARTSTRRCARNTSSRRSGGSERWQRLTPPSDRGNRQVDAKSPDLVELFHAFFFGIGVDATQGELQGDRRCRNPKDGSGSEGVLGQGGQKVPAEETHPLPRSRTRTAQRGKDLYFKKLSVICSSIRSILSTGVEQAAVPARVCTFYVDAPPRADARVGVEAAAVRPHAA